MKYCGFWLSGQNGKNSRIFSKNPKNVSKRTKRDFFKTFKNNFKLLFKVFDKVLDKYFRTAVWRSLVVRPDNVNSTPI